jgi:hypothetical protein
MEEVGNWLYKLRVLLEGKNSQVTVLKIRSHVVKYFQLSLCEKKPSSSFLFCPVFRCILILHFRI